MVYRILIGWAVAPSCLMFLPEIADFLNAIGNKLVLDIGTLLLYSIQHDLAIRTEVED